MFKYQSIKVIIGNNTPEIQTGIYQVKDNSGQIWVISSSQIPKRNETVLVQGTVSTGMEILGKKFGTVIKAID